MRVYIWQQWASNHSANYDVIGVFETVEAAQKAGNVFTRFLNELIAWYVEEGTPEQITELAGMPSPVEQKYAEVYGFDWHQAVDWIRHYPWSWGATNYRRSPLDHLFIYDRLVGVHAFSQMTWQTGHQFANLIVALGGRTYRDIYMGYPPNSDEIAASTINFTISCEAPSETITNDICDSLLNSDENPPSRTWAVFHPHYNRASFVTNRELFQIVALDLQKDQEKVQFSRGSMVDQFLREAHIYQPRCDIEGQRLIIQASGAYNMAAVLPSLLAWLRFKRCVNITYELSEIPYGPGKP